MFNKYAGDTIAQEMLRFMKKADYSDDGMDLHGDMAKDSHETDDSDLADDAADLHSDEAHDAEDYLMDDSAEDHDADDDLSMAMSDMSDYAYDEANDVESEFGMADDNKVASAGDLYLMNGLGKIEASLRRKGEGFAADLVRATAYEIREDIVKQAKQKDQVLKELVKMASGLIDRGEYRAAEMVRMTINKINR
jgi:hypothetical protein